MWIPVLTLQFFLFLAEKSFAIQCYQCVGDGVSTDCNDPFNPYTSGATRCEGMSCLKGKAVQSGRNFMQDLAILNCRHSNIMKYV